MAKAEAAPARSKLRKKTADTKQYQLLNWEGTFDDYLEYAYKNPKVICTAYQRLYDMIMSHGFEMREYKKKQIPHYFFFDNCEPPIRGLKPQKDALVKFFRGAAGHYGTERRVCLLHGPVGSAKSTIANALKRGLEKYSVLQEGFWTTIKWVNLPTDDGTAIQSEELCPMHEEPLKLVPEDERGAYLADLNEKLLDSLPEGDDKTSHYDLRCVGELCPCCKKYMKVLLKKYNGDWDAVIDKHVRVVRMTHSEGDRVGIGTFQPKDEKNQDSTELTGDINYQKIAHFGKDSDPRAFNFDGELNIANRGIVEFIEMLKLDVAFLYDLLGASQEKKIKPKKFPQISVDEVILAILPRPDAGPGQRLHGSVAGPDDEDRHPVHQRVGGGHSRPQGPVQVREAARRPAHDRDGVVLAHPDPPRRRPEWEAHPDPEGRALQRGEHAGVQRGLRHRDADEAPRRGA